MDKTLKFAVDRMELIEEVNKSQFARVKLFAFASGNNAHQRPVSEETLKRCADTIYDKPLVFALNKYGNDADGHDPEEVPCGFVHRENNPIEFIRLDDGRLMLAVEAMIWKRYSGEILSFFERDGLEKPVSVEIQIIEEKENERGQLEIIDLCYMAITILGSLVKPAIESARAEILAFSDAKTEYETSQKEGEPVIKEAVEKFSLNSNQIHELLSNALCEYKYGENGWRKYWVNCFDDVYAYVEDCEDCKTYRMTYTIVDNVATVDVESAEEVIRGNYIPVNQASSTEEMVADNKEECSEEQMASDENNEETMEAEVPEGQSEEQCAVDEDSNEESEEVAEQVQMSFDEMKSKMDEMQAMMDDMKSKMDMMSAENDQLKQEKFARQEQEKQSTIEFTLQEVCEFMPKEKVDELREDGTQNFSTENINIWINKVKAEAFSFTKEKVTKEDYIKVALPFTAEKPKKNGLWD